jgi:RNA polymerase primary sigma factor
VTHTGPVTLTVLTNGPSPAEQLTDLVALGRARGSLTIADVMVALDRADLPPEAIDAAVRALTDEGVDVLDVPREDEPEIRPAEADGGKRAATSDLVRIYLREIGRVPLLTCSPRRSSAGPSGFPASSTAIWSSWPAKGSRPSSA